VQVGIYLWQRAGMRGMPVVFSPRDVERELCVKRHSAHRALQALENRGLVRVERAPGRKARVTILDAPSGIPEGTARIEAEVATTITLPTPEGGAAR
jgi:DNA-binding MarR family transcriptional regulator